jgi:uncharacterized membrane protein YphA (DoxX/SURF4 family)
MCNLTELPMTLSTKMTTAVIEIICGLYVLLLVYAALSKLLDFENFRVQIAQSPVTAAYAGIIAWAIPSIELLISVFLAVARYRRVTLISAYTLMLVFTAYIYIVLNYSSYVPCSCGGILEKLGWTEHFYFNLTYVLLAAVAVLLHDPETPGAIRRNLLQLLLFGTFGIAFMWGLYSTSESAMQHNNSFIRNFTFNPNKVHEMDLYFNSFYLAGATGQKIYLGNTTAPLIVTETDLSLHKSRQSIIKLDKENFAFRSLQLQVNESGFYLTDGTVPVIFRGQINQGWKASLLWKGGINFTQARVVDSSFAAVRCFDRDNNFALAGINLQSSGITIKNGLLKSQVDGRFDLDGRLLFDDKTKELVYQHYYKNEFIITDNRLNLISRGKTIDTIHKAQVKVAYVKSREESKFATPPLTVTHNSCVDNGYLFVQSGLRGRFENKKMWMQASIIDVYEVSSKRYISSFYVYHENGEKLRSFLVYRGHLYGLAGDKLFDYELHKAVFTTKKLK